MAKQKINDTEIEYTSISSEPKYSSKSVEELRYEDKRDSVFSYKGNNSRDTEQSELFANSGFGKTLGNSSSLFDQKGNASTNLLTGSAFLETTSESGQGKRKGRVVGQRTEGIRRLSDFDWGVTSCVGPKSEPAKSSIVEFKSEKSSFGYGFDNQRSSRTSWTERVYGNLEGGMPSNPYFNYGDTLDSYNKGLIALINKVRDMGVSKTIDLPTIVFCGKQSAGKTSLLEAISGVSLPRAAGTCTRTPMEIRLSSSNSPWVCRITIRYFKEELNAEEDENECGFKFEKTVHDKESVSSSVSDAQDEILEASGNVKFSKSVVCVDIKGPDVGDLTLIDLPGLIETTESSDDYKYIDLVKNMVLEYINKKNAIIAMVISCKEDMESQSIKTISNQIDPSGERTIGILTKPDTIEEDCHDQYLAVLRGKRYPLRLGYYIVKNPSQVEINEGMLRSDALEREKQFFQNTSPWMEMGMDRTFSNRYGCSNLSKRLGELLALKIKSQISSLHAEVFEKINNTKKALAEIPKGFKNADTAKNEIMLMFMKLKENIISHVMAREGSKEFINLINRENERFWAFLKKEKPTFELKEEKEEEDNQDPFGKDIEYSYEYIKSIILQEKGRDLIANLGHEPISRIIRTFIKKWEIKSEELIIRTAQYYRQLVINISNELFGNYKQLNKAINDVLIKELQKKEDDAKKQTDLLFSIEKNILFTLNNNFLLKLREKQAKNLEIRFKKYKKYCQENEVTVTFQSNDPMRKPKNSAHKLKDSVKNVILVVSTIMSYYKIAYKRFGDIVPMAIDRIILRDYSENIFEVLMSLSESWEKNPEKFENIIEEDSSVKMQRNFYSKNLEKLQNALHELSLNTVENGEVNGR